MKAKLNRDALKVRTWRLFCSLLALETGGLICAQSPAIQPAPPTPPVVAPRDVDYPAVTRVDVDATDLDRRIFDVRQIIPVPGAGQMTLLYPKWIPGTHSGLNSTVPLMAGPCRGCAMKSR